EFRRVLFRSRTRPRPPALGDAHPVRLDLRGRVRVVETLREQLLPFLELADVDEFVHDVEVDVPSVPRPQVMRRDHEVAILVADAHVAPLRGEELDFQGPKDGAGPRSEDPANGLHVLKAFEVLREGLVVETDGPGDDDVRELGGTHRRRTPERIRRASRLWDFGASVREPARIRPSGPIT